MQGMSSPPPVPPPLPPPPVPVKTDASPTALWQTGLLLLNLVLVAALGALFAIQQQNYRRDLAELQGEFAKKLDEQTKNIKSELDDLRQQELGPLKQEAGQSKNLDERLKKLEGALNGLSKQISDVSKKLQQSGEDGKEKPKSEPDKGTKHLQQELQKIAQQLEELRKELEGLKRSLLRELTVNLESKLTEDNRLVFSGKTELPIAAEIYEAQVFRNAEPVSDRVQQSSRVKALTEISLVRQFGDATGVSLVLALPAKAGAELELRSSLPQRLRDPDVGRDRAKSLEQFEKFLQGLELRLVDRKGTVWLVKLECRLSEEDRKRLLQAEPVFK
jgi:DNA-binding FrmR family transcriptional regulator